MEIGRLERGGIRWRSRNQSTTIADICANHFESYSICELKYEMKAKFYHTGPARWMGGCCIGGVVLGVDLATNGSTIYWTWSWREFPTGQRTQDQTHLLQGQGLQKAHPTQGHTIQGWKGRRNLAPTLEFVLIYFFPGIAVRARKASLWSQTIRLWWSDKTRFPQEGQDYEEGCVKIGVHILQDEGTVGVEAMQAFRTWVRIWRNLRLERRNG